MTKLMTMAAAATIAATTAATAAELGSTGISVGAELDTYWSDDAGSLQSVLTPSAGFSKWGIDFSASTDMELVKNDMVQLDEAFKLDVVDLEAGYTLGSALSARAYVGADVDVSDWDMSGLKAGVSIKF